MKQIIIFLLVVIVFILGFNLYRDYKRFHAPGSDYVASKAIDKNYHDKAVVQQYYQTVEELNSYVRMQWASEGVDVRNPEDDDQETKDGVAGYNRILGNVKMLENKLVSSAEMKHKGLADNDVIDFEQSGYSGKDYDVFLKNNYVVKTFMANPEKYAMKVGDYGSFVYELQKLLVKKGYNIPVDGLFRDITFNAVYAFEKKNGLFPDGKLDPVTLDYLLR